ncbi:hypothetical protein PQQ78_17650 [Paraburkholderia sediminicola]
MIPTVDASFGVMVSTVSLVDSWITPACTLPPLIVTGVGVATLKAITASATVTLPRVMPYLGIGYVHKPVSKGFGMTFDLGVAYGRPRTSYNVPAIYSMFTPQSNIDEQ